MDDDLKLVEHHDSWAAVAAITRLHAEIEALKSDVSDLVRAGSDEATEVERLVKERDEARAGMAYILDHATYGDSYGVHGSDFECCHFCQGGGAPGVALEHTPDCPVSKYPNAVTEWFAEMAENNKDRETAEAQRDAAYAALRPFAVWSSRMPDVVPEFPSDISKVVQIAIANGHLTGEHFRAASRALDTVKEKD